MNYYNILEEFDKKNKRVKRLKKRKKRIEPCKTCIYRASEEYMYMKCDYIGITGRMRPCDAGVKCTVYKRGPRKQEILITEDF